MARPWYKPTESDRNTVRIMAAIGINHERIAACLGTKGIDDKTMRRHFRRELDVSADQMNAIAGQGLAKALQAGEAWAICFWMKTRMGWREKSEVAHTGPDGGPIQMDVLTSAKDVLANRIAGIAARSRTPENS